MKAVIPVAGLGTRLLPATKEQPKEMLPIFYKGPNGKKYVAPIVQIVYEQLYDFGIRDFCFIMGRGKRSIEEHFSQDFDYIALLKKKKRDMVALESFYKKLENSTINWVTQPSPSGFGNAILMAKSFVGNEPFIVHAGDTYMISKNNAHLKRMELTQKFRKHWEKRATLLLQEVKNISQYGIAEVKSIDETIFTVKNVVEKPKKSPSDLALVGIYIFSSHIFKEVEKTNPDAGGEIQLTDAIQNLINNGGKIFAVKLKSYEVRLDIGSPEIYWDALKTSYDSL